MSSKARGSSSTSNPHQPNYKPVTDKSSKYNSAQTTGQKAPNKAWQKQPAAGSRRGHK